VEQVHDAGSDALGESRRGADGGEPAGRSVDGHRRAEAVVRLTRGAGADLDLLEGVRRVGREDRGQRERQRSTRRTARSAPPRPHTRPPCPT
jgi:hypothetical protein